jgi:tRNA pseudouridine38-40 synthase
LKRYFIQLSYKGTNFCGWQFQPNAKTVQEELQNSIKQLFRTQIDVTGAGRTDTGVHAGFYIAHFETDIFFEPEKIKQKLNKILNKDIAIHKIFEVDSHTHSRFDALSRTYEYHIHLIKNPFIQEFSTFLYWKPDIEKMNSASKILFEVTDFTSFSKLHTDVKTNNCKIYKAEWKEFNSKLIFTIEADRFLRNMVRAIVGTLLEIGKNKIDENEFRQIIELKNRSKAGISVPAQGLILTDIKYTENINSQFIRLS